MFKEQAIIKSNRLSHDERHGAELRSDLIKYLQPCIIRWSGYCVYVRVNYFTSELKVHRTKVKQVQSSSEVICMKI